MKSKCFYCLFQLALNSALVVLFHSDAFSWPGWRWLLICTICYMLVVGIMYISIFQYKDISALKIIAFLFVGMGGMGIILAVYPFFHQMLTGFTTASPRMVSQMEVGILLFSFQGFVLVLFSFIAKQFKGKTLSRQAWKDLFFWSAMMLSIYIAAFASYELNAAMVFTGEFDAVARRYLWEYDYFRSNFNINAASIIAPSGLITALVIALSKLIYKDGKQNLKHKRKKGKIKTCNKGFVILNVRHSSEYQTKHVDEIEYPKATIIIDAFALFALYTVGVWLATWIRGFYTFILFLSPFIVLYYYVVRRYVKGRK